MNINIRVRRTHVILLAVLVVGATATATVDIKDQTNIFQTLNMTGNPIQNLQNPSNPQDAATKNYVDNNAGGFEITGTYSSTGSDCAAPPKIQYSNVGATASASASCDDPDASVIAQGSAKNTGITSAFDRCGEIGTPAPSDIAMDWRSRGGSSFGDGASISEYMTDALTIEAKVRVRIVCGK